MSSLKLWRGKEEIEWGKGNRPGAYNRIITKKESIRTIKPLCRKERERERALRYPSCLSPSRSIFPYNDAKCSFIIVFFDVTARQWSSVFVDRKKNDTEREKKENSVVLAAGTTTTGMKKKEREEEGIERNRQRNGKSVQEIIIIEMIEVEATSAVVVATNKRNNSSLQFDSCRVE